jgi:hypothetical protein
LAPNITERTQTDLSEKRVLRIIFGPKRDEVTADWRKLHSEELHNVYSPPNIIRMIKSSRMRLKGYVEHMQVIRNAYKILVGKQEGKRPLRRPRYRWEDNIKPDLTEMGLEDVNWIHPALDRDLW